jgi:hypothetical protein
MLGISLLTERVLASEEGLISVEVLNYKSNTVFFCMAIEKY